MTALQHLPVWADSNLTPGPQGRMVVGQLGQSLDGYIATSTGHSKYINGKGGLAHLHQLRASVDAVLVGVGTVVADDPMLTVRLCSGRSPTRVVLDPRGRVPTRAKIFQDDGVRCIVLTRCKEILDLPACVEVIELPEPTGLKTEHINPKDVLNLLAEQGMNRVLVEGGARTLSQFIDAGCVDHLHLIVAPLILGSGKAGLNLKALSQMQDVQRFHIKTYGLEPDLLFDCDLRPTHLQI
jgi:diaminohydroxyphosphoribosylaminopyrimidine deaminase/5-amino-6-(5-phosphoribosylamino)uracil reductase